MNQAEISIDGRKIGSGHSPFIICELSGNHNGDLDKALAMIEAAAKTGCDAIKLQTYTPDTMTIDSERPEFWIRGGPWDGKTLYQLYQETHTPFEWHPALFSRAHELGVLIFSSPFDESAVDLLESLNTPAYKIASFEMVDLPLLAYIASKKKPIIISTGMANLEEIEAAVDTAKYHGANEIVLLHCVSSYPAEVADANVRTVADLALRFGCPSGLSDHTIGTAVSIAAVAAGACVIEKHFTLSRNDGDPDADFSLEPLEFSALVRDCRSAHLALGNVHYQTLPSEVGSKQFRRSLYSTHDTLEGELFTKNNVRSIRPGLGLAPKHLWQVLGKRAARRISRGEPLLPEMIAGPHSL